MLVVAASGLAAEAGAIGPEDEALPTLTVRAQRTANEYPASLYATNATALRYDPEADLQARGLPEGQADVTVRGGVTVHYPQTGHYTTLLPIDADVLSRPALLTDTAHALYGFNANVATVAYDWRPLTEYGEVALGIGTDALTVGATAMADTRTDGSGTVTGTEARYTSASGDGSRPYGDHALERALVHAQRRTRLARTDLAVAWQDSLFGWPGAYTGFASLPETDDTKTALLIANHRLTLASGAGDTKDADHSWVAFGAYYRDLHDDYDFDRRNEESGTPGSFEHRTRSYAAAVTGRHAGARWAWRYALQLSADELDSGRYLKLNLAQEYAARRRPSRSFPAHRRLAAKRA